jgi:hypothetical protein
MKNLKILFFILLISPLVFSQNKKTPEEKATMQTERFAKELNLSEEQKAQFLIIQTGINQKLEGIRSSKMSEEEKKNSINSIREARISMINSILSDKQKQKMTTLEEKQKRKIKKKDRNRKK